MPKLIVTKKDIGEMEVTGPLLILVRQGAATKDERILSDTVGKILPLIEAGRKQAENAGRLLEQFIPLEDFPIGTIYTSPTVRARQTAETLSSYLRGKVETEPLLRERDLGSYSDYQFADVSHQYQILLKQAHHGYPDIESWDSIKARSEQFIQKVSSNKIIVAVSNPEFIRATLSKRLGNLPEIKMSEAFIFPGSINIIDYYRYPQTEGRYSGIYGINLISFEQF